MSPVRVGVVGLGKMGISHLSMIRAHPDVEVVGVVDSAKYVLDVLSKYTGLNTFDSLDAMLDTTALDAVIIATPTRLHAPMVEKVLERGLHVMCEKPLTLDPADSERLAESAHSRGLVSQVGYHNRFVGTFREVKRLLDLDAIGEVTHVRAEAYGPVVLKPKGSTWRSDRSEGGGCLFDYAAHPIDLMSWYLGEPIGVGGTVLGKIFSQGTDDEVYSTVYFPGDVTGQVSVNWSDESFRKMTTQITLWGKAGRIYADRQEIQVYLRDEAPPIDGYVKGWNVRYTTELTDEVWFYLRGEEYSAQIDYFVKRVRGIESGKVNDFSAATTTDRILDMMLRDAQKGPSTTSDSVGVERIVEERSLGEILRSLVREMAPKLRRTVNQLRQKISDVFSRSRDGVER